MRGLRLFFFMTLIFGALHSEAQTRSGLGFFVEGAYGFSGGRLYKDLMETGPVWNVGLGFRYESFLLNVALGQYAFSKTESEGSTGKLSHQNKIDLNEVVARYHLGEDWGIALGYANMSHVEDSYLYEEIVPGQESPVAQAGTLKSPEGAVLAGLFYIIPFTSFDLFFEGRYYQTQTNKIHLVQGDLGLRYYF